MESGLMTKTEMAKFLKIAEVTLDSWRRQGLPCIKLNRKVLFDKEKVLQWLNSNSKK